MGAKGDALVRTDAWLKQRDGIDKLLKVLRYSAKIGALYSSEASGLASLEKQVALSRKSLRLGKFLSNVIALRALLRSTDGFGQPGLVLIDAATNASEGVYYFLEQILFLAKVGALDKKNEERYGRLAVWCELMSYVGSITLKLNKLKLLQEQERRTKEQLAVSGANADLAALGAPPPNSAVALPPPQEEAASRRRAVQLGVLQDFTDAAVAIGDLRGGILSHPLVVSVCGLVSAAISISSKW